MVLHGIVLLALARGLYLARHLPTLLLSLLSIIIITAAILIHCCHCYRLLLLPRPFLFIVVNIIDYYHYRGHSYSLFPLLFNIDHYYSRGRHSTAVFDHMRNIIGMNSYRQYVSLYDRYTFVHQLPPSRHRCLGPNKSIIIVVCTYVSLK